MSRAVFYKARDEITKRDECPDRVENQKRKAANERGVDNQDKAAKKISKIVNDRVFIPNVGLI